MKEVIASMVPEAVGQLPDGFHRPGMLIAAGVAVAATVTVEMIQTRLDRKPMGSELTLADDDMQQSVTSGLNQHRLLGRVGAGLGATTLAFGAVHAAQPYNTEGRVNGEAVVIVDGRYTGDIQDMLQGGKKVTRLDSSINGVLKASEQTDVPITLMVNGKRAETLGRTENGTLNVGAIKQKEDSVLTASMRNGNALGEAVMQARTLLGSGGGNIIVINPNLHKDEDKIRVVGTVDQLKKSKAGKITAIALGDGDASIDVAASPVDASVDAKSWADAIGRPNVKTAKSTDEIANIIKGVTKTQEIAHKDTPNENALYAMITAGLLLAGHAYRRRYGGLLRRAKGRK